MVNICMHIGHSVPDVRRWARVRTNHHLASRAFATRILFLSFLFYPRTINHLLYFQYSAIVFGFQMLLAFALVWLQLRIMNDNYYNTPSPYSFTPSPIW